MIYISIILAYLDSHIIVLSTVLGCLFGLHIVFNMLFSPYIKHNRALRNSIRKLRHTVSSGKVVPFVSSIPHQYRAQWHCYVTAHSAPAVSMFTPVDRAKSRLSILQVLSSITALLCLVVYIANGGNNIALYSFCTYLVLIIPACCIDRVVDNSQYKGACRVFSRWVSLVQAYYGNGDMQMPVPTSNTDIEDMINQLKLVAKCNKQERTSRIATILGSCRQDQERTVGQQRRINNTLNSLLVAD